MFQHHGEGCYSSSGSCAGNLCPDVRDRAGLPTHWKRKTHLKSLLILLLVPPGNLVLLAAGGLVWHRRRAGRLLAALSVAGLLALSLPVVADSLLAALDVEPPAAARPPAAIVVLGAEVETDARPSQPTEPGPLSLERERTAAELARRTGLPVLVSGGVVRWHADPVAVAMARSLRSDFGIDPRWVEAKSSDTWENARDSAAILAPLGIGSVFLVTHGWHMRRALVAFAAAGLSATPAPVRRDRWPRLELDDFLPHATAWGRSYYAIHEWLGWAVYLVRARLSRD
jgi:uncharacterized SAM-binding protein YcdF (DUF218 family)